MLDPMQPQMPPQVPNNTPYIVAVVLMVLGGVLGSVVINVFRSTQDNTLVIAAIFGFLAPTTLSLLAFMKAQETHLSVNSRLDGFINNAAAAANAQGIITGQQQANDRTDALVNSVKA